MANSDESKLNKVDQSGNDSAPDATNKDVPERVSLLNGEQPQNVLDMLKQFNKSNYPLPASFGDKPVIEGLDAKPTNQGIRSWLHFEPMTTFEQVRINRLVRNLPNAIEGGTVTTLDWVSDFAKINDNSALKYDKKAIAEKLTQAGFGALPENHPDGKEYTKTPEGYARWIIGRAVGSLNEGMPMHPITEHFARQLYQEFPNYNRNNATGIPGQSQTEFAESLRKGKGSPAPSMRGKLGTAVGALGLLPIGLSLTAESNNFERLRFK